MAVSPVETLSHKVSASHAEKEIGQLKAREKQQTALLAKARRDYEALQVASQEAQESEGLLQEQELEIQRLREEVCLIMLLFPLVSNKI